MIENEWLGGEELREKYANAVPCTDFGVTPFGDGVFAISMQAEHGGDAVAVILGDAEVCEQMARLLRKVVKRGRRR